jgi:hypothetical protein
MRRTKILLSAAGTASAFHLAELIREKFPHVFELYLCDTNPKHLVASAGFADHFFQVPPAAAPDFRAVILGLLAREHIEIYVPLVDLDTYTFPCDDRELSALGVRSTSVPMSSAAILREKNGMSQYLRSKGFAVPQAFSAEEVLRGAPGEKFFAKPAEGFGSRGAAVMSVSQIKELMAGQKGPGWVFQEVCPGPELTIEVFNHQSTVRALCRERLEVKSGVCTKARVWRDAGFTALSERLCKALILPVAFCYQVMKNAMGEWAITDLNPRIGAGTSLATVCNWSLASAALAVWAGLEVSPLSFLEEFTDERFAVRAYRDFRTV